ncbi:hypothetical protein [Pantoea septica]|uniref:hypothetical protein n=1 Tax=Pantoea septica TaxID=472695 RepID=UPI001C116A07|nr:hypothetical protein [Pantoea septica]MBU5379168.1 hypothetical protein [Pantoea septica]
MHMFKKNALVILAPALIFAAFIPAAMPFDAGVNTGRKFTDVTLKIHLKAAWMRMLAQAGSRLIWMTKGRVQSSV